MRACANHARRRFHVSLIARCAVIERTQSASFLSSITPRSKSRVRLESLSLDRLRFSGRTRVVPRARSAEAVATLRTLGLQTETPLEFVAEVEKAFFENSPNA
jgi:hypothetical protein